MNRLPILIFFALSGCTLPMAPPDVLKTGTKITGTIKRQPADAARCIGRHLENEKHYVKASDRTGEVPGTVEMIVRGHGDTTFTMSVWIFKPTATGADFTVHVATYLWNTIPAEYVSKAIASC